MSAEMVELGIRLPPIGSVDMFYNDIYALYKSIMYIMGHKTKQNCEVH
jgi:hypothetical protein